MVVMGLGASAASADDRPRLEDVAPQAPAWAKDCTLDLVDVGDDAFTVAVACRGSEELVFERRALTPRELEDRARAEADEIGAPRTKLSIATARGSATGYAMIYNGGAHVLVWRAPTKGPSDVYACASSADREAHARCTALVEAFARSTVIRRGRAAFPRPKS